METIRTIYVPAIGNNGFECTDIEIDLKYDLGGYNCWNNTQRKRGYRISVTPVVRKNGLILYTEFSGAGETVLECKRKSKKAELEAIKIFETTQQKYIDYICRQHDLRVRT